MKGLPMSTRRKDPMASRWSEKIPHSCEPPAPHTSQEEKTTPPSYSQQPAVADNVIKWEHIANSFLFHRACIFVADDVGGLLRFSSQNQTIYFMVLHTNSDPSSSGRFSIPSSNLSLPVTCFRICSWQGFSDVCALDLFFQSFVQPILPWQE